MPNRYVMKVEVEYECPASVAPAETFNHYFKERGMVENVKIKILDVQKKKLESKIDQTARGHNEHRRVLNSILTQVGLKCKIQKGWHRRLPALESSFRVWINEPNAINNYVFVTVMGATIKYGDKEYNLADPNVAPQLIQAMKCSWSLCNHADKRRHK